MESARLKPEQSKSDAVSHRSQKTLTPVTTKSHWSVALNDAHPPAMQLGQAFGPLRAFVPAIQTKLTLSEPGDQYEQEADRVAEQVMRLPDSNFHLQRKCGCGGSSASGGSCEACGERQSLVQRSATGRSATENRAASENNIPLPVHHVLRSGGRPLETSTRSFMESRFNQDFSQVRIHTGMRASESAAAVRARAYTLGHHVVFGSGQYAPETMAGQKLLAHELAHVVQQRSGDVRRETSGGGTMPSAAAHVSEHLPQTTLAGDWIIDSPSHKSSAKGKTDAELLGDAFKEICALTARKGDRITLLAGAPATGNLEGCDCLQVIENDLKSAAPVQVGTPHIEMDIQGWSTTLVGPGSPAKVRVRHPESTYEWGYWTGGQSRHLKPFWQTVAHEICGHVAAFVRTRGANVGSRGVGMGHNIAIEGENLVAAEHGVVKSEQRGLDMDPKGTPLPGHRGESFLQGTIFDFDHASDLLPAAAKQVISDAVNSVVHLQKSGMELFIQVEGFSLTNEGSSLAMQRAINVRKQIETEFKAKKISLTFPFGSGASPVTMNRLRADLATGLSGSSTAATSNPGRRVQVYLFHQAHSAGP